MVRIVQTTQTEQFCAKQFTPQQNYAGVHIYIESKSLDTNNSNNEVASISEDFKSDWIECMRQKSNWIWSVHVIPFPTTCKQKC